MIKEASIIFVYEFTSYLVDLIVSLVGLLSLTTINLSWDFKYRSWFILKYYKVKGVK